ncbi:MAG: hypothetical protein C0456_13780 [Hyphomonas sp.]|uniref:hypothetical protein n=1 Tax=Hyphomonas sp. TaxID=87 RepID=UPI001DF55648|nr:hypothetical protein [Hyphomonas sp.]MBA4227693.1 hypothetical protein [Hyphomonas sp.]
MPSVSDIGGLAEALYSSAGIVLLSVIVASSHLKVGNLIDSSFQLVNRVAFGDSKMEELHPVYRLTFLLFLFLVWPPFFTTFGNLIPFTLVYSNEWAFFQWSDINRVAKLSCAMSEDFSLFQVSRLIAYSQESLNYPLNEVEHVGFVYFGVAKSLTAVLILASVVSLLSPSSRKFSLRAFLFSIAVIFGFGYTGYQLTSNHIESKVHQVTNTLYSSFEISGRFAEFEEECLDVRAQVYHESRDRLSSELPVSFMFVRPAFESIVPIQDQS